METLPEEFRTAIAPVHVAFASALLGHWGDAAEGLQIFGPGKSFTLRAHAGQQAGRQDRSGARQCLKDLPIGVLLENFGDLFLELLDRFQEQLEFFADELDAQRVALEQSDLVAQRHRFFNALQTLLDEFLAARALEVVELFERFFAGFL